MWPQAQAAAARAEALLRLRRRRSGRGRARQRLAARAGRTSRPTSTLLESLEAIRLRQADVEDNHFVVRHSRKEYEQAFVTYGLHRNAMAPEEAARALSRGLRRVRATLLAALDHWLILASYEKAPEAAWLKQVLALADSDPWRQGVRLAREKNDRQAMEKLAREVDTALQPPEALFVLEMGLRQRGCRRRCPGAFATRPAGFPGRLLDQPRPRDRAERLPAAAARGGHSFLDRGRGAAARQPWSAIQPRQRAGRRRAAGRGDRRLSPGHRPEAGLCHGSL